MHKFHKSHEKINHLVYMNNIKLFAKTEKESETLIQPVSTYSQDIGMEFAIEKCTILIMKSRKWQMTEGIEILNQEKMGTMGEKENYKYLKQISLKKWKWN